MFQVRNMRINQIPHCVLFRLHRPRRRLFSLRPGLPSSDNGTVATSRLPNDGGYKSWSAIKAVRLWPSVNPRTISRRGRRRRHSKLRPLRPRDSRGCWHGSRALQHDGRPHESRLTRASLVGLALLALLPSTADATAQWARSAKYV